MIGMLCADQDVKQLLSAVADPTLLTGKLLSAAVKEAAATKPNWPEFTAKQEQAAHDAAVFSLLLDTERKSSKVHVLVDESCLMCEWIQR